MLTLDVNTGAAKDLTRKLSEISRSAFPVAVRGALNNAAFDVKQNTMLRSAKQNFTERSPNFFKATSTVDMARGFDVVNMQAAVGFDKGKAKATGNVQAVEDLEKQEFGGAIEGRSFVPMDTARTGGNKAKMVRPNARLRQLKFVSVKNQKGPSNPEKFIQAILEAGAGGFVLGKKFLWRVNALRSRPDSKSTNGWLDLTPLYNFKKGRKAPVNRTGFMEEASKVTAKKLDDYYITQARKQFEKYLK